MIQILLVMYLYIYEPECIFLITCVLENIPNKFKLAHLILVFKPFIFDKALKHLKWYEINAHP